MSGFMRKAALVVGAVALIAATAGAAAVALAPAAMAGTAGIGAVSAATLTAIGTYGGLAAGVLSAISVATAPKATSQGSATTFQTNPQSGLPYAIGRTRMSGVRMFAATNTRPGYTKFNDLLWFGALLSIGGQIDSIEKFTIDNELVTFDASGNAIGTYHDYQGQKLHLGGPQSSALALTLGGGAAPGWTSQHRLSGITHAMWCLRYNKQGEMYGAGAPEPAWIGKWVKVYDPRLDSTFPGGNGSCRALEESTYVWSDNPALHALTWALGRWQNGKRTCGIGAPVANIRVAEFVECANVCDANDWTAGGVEWTTDSKWDTLKRMLQAGGARPTQTGAMIGCLVSTPRTAIATIESRHLLDSLSIAATKSRRDRFNSVIPRYIDEDSDWSMISGTVVSVPEYVTADGGERTKEVDYPLVQVFSGQIAKQPGQLAAYDIVNSREAGPINFTTGPEWIGLKTGDVVLLNVPEEGLVNQPVLITRRAPDPSTGKVSFSAETETYAKHAYALGQSTTPPAPFSLTAPDLKPPAPTEESWAAVGTVTGEGLPAIAVSGSADMPSADAVLIDYKLSADQEWARAAILSANEPVLHVIAPLASQTSYDVRVGYRVGEIDGDFVILYAVTGEGKLSGIEAGATVGATQAEKDQISQLEQDTLAAQTAIAAAQQQIATIESSVTADFSAVNQAVAALNGEVDAAQGNITALQSATSAVQQSVSTLQGDLSAALGSIGSLQSFQASASQSITDLQSQAADIIGSIGALGTEVDQVSATVSTQGASISTLQQTVTSLDGSVATLSTQVTAGGGNLLVNTDFAIDVSGWVLDGNQGATGGLNLPGPDWKPATENVLTIVQANATGSGQTDWTQILALEGGKWLDVSVGAASHRANIQIYLQCIDAAGNVLDTGTTGAFTPAGGGNTLASFPVRSFKMFAPAGTVSGKLFLRKFGTSSGADSYAWFLRPQVAETTASRVGPVPYSPGSARASIETQAQAITTLDGSLSSLTTRVGTAESSISSNATAISTAQGNLASLTTRVGSAEGSITTLQSSYTSLSGTVASLSSTVSTQGSSITSLQSAVSTSQGNIATLATQVSAGGGNLLQNTDIIDLSYWVFGSQGDGSTGSRVAAGGDWVLADENALHIAQNNGGTSGFSEWWQWLSIRAGRWYDTSAQAAAHRCNVEVYLQWYDAGGNAISAPSTGQTAAGPGTHDLSNWTHLGFKAQAPSNAIRARLILRKFATNAGASEASSYAWFCRPQVKETLAASATPQAYSIGSARGVVEIQAQALSTLGSSFASLETRVSSAEGSVTSLSQSLTSANGSISSLQTSVNSLNGSVSTLQQSSSTQAGQISGLQSTVTTQGGQISTNAQAITALSGSLATLNTVVTASSSPNICPNGGFENGLRGWRGGGAQYQNWVRQTWVWGSWASNPGFTGDSAGHGNYAYLELESPIGIAGDSNGYTLSFDYDMNGGPGCVCYGEIVWWNSSGGYITQSGTAQGGNRSFDATGNSRVKGYVVAPSGASTATVRIVFYAPNGVATGGINVRQIKFEFGSVATPYSGEATASQMFTAYSDLNGSHASLSSTVSSQGGSISSLESSTTTLSGTVSSLSSTVSSLGSSISSLQSVQSTQAGTIATLQQRVTVGGNLLQNTEFVADMNSWSFYAWSGNNSIFNYQRNGAGDGWRPTNENNLSVQQTNNDGNQHCQIYSNHVPLVGGRWYEGSAYVATHRCYSEIRIEWYDNAGNSVGTSASPRSDSFPGFYQSNGGSAIGNYQRLWIKAQAPGNASRALLNVVKHGTSQDGSWAGATDSWMWFVRPQIAEVYADTASPTAYFPGKTSAGYDLHQSSINTLNGQYSSLSSTVSTQGSAISQQATAISNLQGTQASLQSTVSSQGSSISSLQTATSTLQGQAATLTTQVTAGSPNLLRNGGFELGNLNYWTPVGGAWNVSTDVGTWGTYAVNGTNVGDNSWTYLESDQVNIERDWYTLSADFGYFLNSGSGTAYVEIVWWNSSGGVISQTGGLNRAANFNFSSDGYTRRLTVATGYAPEGTTRASARVVWYKSSGTVSSMHVRQVKLERGQVATPYSSEASIVTSYQALSTLSTQYASLSSTVSTMGVTVSTQSTAITTLNGNVAMLFGQYVLQVDVGGVVTGMKLANNGGATSIKFQSDLVEFVGSTTTGRMEMRGGTIFGYDSSNRRRYRIGNRALN